MEQEQLSPPPKKYPFNNTDAIFINNTNKIFHLMMNKVIKRECQLALIRKIS